MPSPLFEFFEIVAEELCVHVSKVITPDNLKTKDKESSLLDDLQYELKASSPEEAIKRAVVELEKHFKAKGAALPFSYDLTTGMFVATDPGFLGFVNDMSRIRSAGKRSRDFECRVAERLQFRATGTIHRVGHPRDVRKKKTQFNAHLQTLGFARPVALGREKDGGLDILWQLPMGTIPHRPFVSVQCKNGKFDMDAAQASIGTGSMSLSQYAGLQAVVHVPCVLFNDYLYPQRLTAKQLNFVPLGLTDLASMEQDVSVEFI
jgi:hypothetical protein